MNDLPGDIKIQTIEEGSSEDGSSATGLDLVVALDGFDGPIDLLLNLAREQKVDLSTISILALAEQYLDYIHSARNLRLEIAADYLVMAAWLAYLKSRLLLPEIPEDEQNPAEMAEALKFQLLRLEAMQKVAAQLFDLPQLGADFFMRGCPDRMSIEEKPVYYLPIYDLLAALGAPQRRRKPNSYDIKPTRLYSLEESLLRMRRMLGGLPNWDTLFAFLPNMKGHEGLQARSAIASTFAAVLELVKAGEVELRQSQNFGTIYLRTRAEDSAPSSDQPSDRS
ncbi:MAG: ScpA family protein [Alphaproteobacteria bacterium]|nr:ScpA family protein [Alphaproteobacteria bacterium]